MLPESLEADKRFLGQQLETAMQYTFHGIDRMPPSQQAAGGAARIVDSTNVPVARKIAPAMVTIKPGGQQELHWHPNNSEWQYWIKGKGRMTVIGTQGKARHGRQGAHQGLQSRRGGLCA